MKPLRFAIVGCGAIATTHAEALRALPPGDALLAGCCDVVSGRAAEFSSRFQIPTNELDALLTDPEIDAISFCTPSGMHAQQAIAALRAGKHVLVEKPMDIRLEACDAILAAQAESGRTFGVISQHRFDPASTLVKQTLDSGGLGKPFLFEARIPWLREQDYYDSGDWRGTLALDGGGALMNQGIHTVDLLRWFAGPLRSVYARMQTSAHDRIDVEDVVAATIELESGAIANLMASTAIYPGFPASLSVYGTLGTAVIRGDRLESLHVRGQAPIAGESATAHAIHIATSGTRAAVAQAGALSAASAQSSVWGDAHRKQFADFIRCCRIGARPVVDGVEGRNAVELVLAVYESARSGQIVTF